MRLAVERLRYRRAPNMIAARALAPLLLAAAALAAPQAPTIESIAFVTTMAGAPADQHFRSVGPRTTGSGRLVAAVAVAGEAVAVELLATLQYVDGSGPFDGFITLTWPQGDAVASRYRGTATRGVDGSTTIVGELDVVDGSGRFVGARGRGSVDGYRSGALGSQVEYTVALAVRTGGASPAAAPGEGDGGSSGVGVAPPGANLVVEVDLAGVAGEQRLTATGPDGRVTTGTARITGIGASNLGEVGVEVLGAVRYRAGSGAFTGLMHLDFGGGSLLLCRYEGRAAAFAGGTRVLGRIDVLAGAGAVAGARGHGRVEGVRLGGIGSPLVSTIAVALR